MAVYSTPTGNELSTLPSVVFGGCAGTGEPRSPALSRHQPERKTKKRRKKKLVENAAALLVHDQQTHAVDARASIPRTPLVPTTAHAHPSAVNSLGPIAHIFAHPHYLSSSLEGHNTKCHQKHYHLLAAAVAGRSPCLQVCAR